VRPAPVSVKSFRTAVMVLPDSVVTAGSDVTTVAVCVPE
jgi:hypothetical protein